MNLHLSIEDDLFGLIELQLLVGPAGAYLDCMRVSYEEIGGEAYNGRRQRTRYMLDEDTLEEIQALLPSSRLPTPESIPADESGSAFTLTIGNGPEAVEYGWISHAPKEWEPLEEVVRILLVSSGIKDRKGERTSG